MSIIKHFVKVLIPFQFNQSEKEILDNTTVITGKGKVHSLFNKIGFETIELRKGLSDLFSEKKNKSQIMISYQLDGNVRRIVGLPKKKNGKVFFCCRDKERVEPYTIEIDDLNVYMFESGVGYAEMEFNYCSCREEDIINGNYYLSEIGDKKNYFLVKHEIWNGETKAKEYEETKFTLLELLGSILNDVTSKTDFYTELSWERIYTKALVYSYLYLDEKPDNFEELLFNLSLNYKESYKVPDKFKSVNESPEILQQFENSYWIASTNAVTNVSLKTDDEVTNNFFEIDFYSKMHNEYYVLFLAAIHQRYVLMKLMYEMGELDQLDLDYFVMKEQLKMARKYQAEAANLKYRDFFKFPSYVQHVNDYYDFLYRIFGVEELYADFTQDLNNIEEICKVYVDKINLYDSLKVKLRKATVKTMVSFIGACVGLITLLNEAWSILETTCGIPSGTFSVPVLLVTIALAIPSVMGVVETANNAREIWKERRKMETETIGLRKKKQKNN